VIATNGSRVDASSEHSTPRGGGVARDRLARELVEARKIALRYPTVADVTAAGYKRLGMFSPGAGAHFVDSGNVGGSGAVDVGRPLAYLYDGVSPKSRVVGLMYYSEAPEQPDGFAGPEDHWHRHAATCIKRTGKATDVLLPPDADVTRAQCERVGGRFQATSGWMLHAWVIPGRESPTGVFSHNNPDLHCADGSDDHDEIGYCPGT
jgi:hypothetical protein